MTRPLPVLPLAALLAPVLMISAGPTRAAESYDNCAGTVPSLPAVIGTQGVWCLKKDLTTPSASGPAIKVNAPNVTIDCNGFKLGGLAAGPATTAVGIEASGTSNLTVRNCNIRGFSTGIHTDATSGGGHLVEDNRFEGNTVFAIDLYGDGSVIRRNQILDTGYTTAFERVRVAAIHTTGNVDISDNAIRVVDATFYPNMFAYAIFMHEGDSATVTGNRVGGIVGGNLAAGYGIRLWTGTGVVVRDNDLFGTDAGIICGSNGIALGNTLRGSGLPLTGCVDAGNHIY